MEAAAPTLEQSLAFPDGIARDGDDNAGDVPYGIDDIDDYDALVEPRPGEAYTQEDVNVMDRPEFDMRLAQHAWYRRLGEVGMGEDNFPGTTDARRRGRQVSFLLGAPTVWERNIDARRRHIQTNAATPDPRMGDTRTRVREAENPGRAWQTPDQVARDIDQEFQDFHNGQMHALRAYGTERHRQAVERQRRRHAEERRQAEELRRIERMANDPANAFDVAQDMREYIDNGRERAQALQQAGDGKMGRDAGTKEPTDQGGSGRFQTGGVDDRTTAEKLRDKQREVQAARDRLAGAEYTRLGTTNAMKRATTDDVRVMGPAGRRSTHIGVTGEARQQYTHGKRQRVSAPAPPDFGGTGVANYHAIVQKSAARVALRQAESEQDALQRQLQQEQAFEQAMQQAQAEAEAEAQAAGLPDGSEVQANPVYALQQQQQGDGITGPILDHIGASAEQQIIAGTGQLPPAPGQHRMPTGEVMADGQTGGQLKELVQSLALITEYADITQTGVDTYELAKDMRARIAEATSRPTATNIKLDGHAITEADQKLAQMNAHTYVPDPKRFEQNAWDHIEGSRAQTAKNVDFAKEVSYAGLRKIIGAPADGTGLTPFGHRYTGLFNEMDAGEPINEVDAGAQTHDYEYQDAASREDVIRADEKFIATVEGTGTVFGMAAGAAIRAKMAVENQFGPIYPPQEYLDNNAATALETTYPELPEAEPGENIDAELLARAIGVAFGWRTLMYGDTETPVDDTGDALDQQTQAMQLAALAATVVWGKGLTELQGASQRLADTVGPPDAVTTDQIVEQILSGTGFYGGTAQKLTRALASMVSSTVVVPQQAYVFSASLDEQWAYVALLAVSRKLALLFLKVCHARRRQGISYGEALTKVTGAKPRRPVNNAIDLMAHFLTKAK